MEPRKFGSMLLAFLKFQNSFQTLFSHVLLQLFIPSLIFLHVSFAELRVESKV